MEDVNNEWKGILQEAKGVQYNYWNGGYEYKGLMCSTMFSPLHRLEAATKYTDFRDDDIIILTYPKSGTHFVGDIVRSALLERDGMDCSEHISGTKHQFCSFDSGPFCTPEDPMGDIDTLPSPRIMITHLPWEHLPEGMKAGKYKMIQMVRNPKDVMCSTYPFLKKGSILTPECTWQIFVENFIAGKMSLSGDYFEWLRQLHAHRNDANLLVVHYEAMNKNLAATVDTLCRFLQLDLNNEQKDRIVKTNTFENRVKTADRFASFFLNKGKSGGWKSQFTVAQNEAVDEWIAKGMVGVEGLKIDFE